VPVAARRAETAGAARRAVGPPETADVERRPVVATADPEAARGVTADAVTGPVVVGTAHVGMADAVTAHEVAAVAEMAVSAGGATAVSAVTAASGVVGTA